MGKEVNSNQYIKRTWVVRDITNTQSKLSDGTLINVETRVSEGVITYHDLEKELGVEDG